MRLFAVIIAASCHIYVLFSYLFKVRKQRGELQRLLSTANALVSVSKGMWAVKLYTNKFLCTLEVPASVD